MERQTKNIIAISVTLLLVLIIIIASVRKSPQRNLSNSNTLTSTKEKSYLYYNYELPCLQTNRSEQIIEHLGYILSYNHEWFIPNWVAYELTKQEAIGEENRSNHFVPDPLVTDNPVETYDYSNSGYDRGHMAPAGDMKWSEQAMRESFYMTNICPQNHNLNAGDWKSLEELARDWAMRYGSIYIACGPIVDKNYTTIGKYHKIAVPSAFYKVFLRRKSNGEWTAIGFVMPNKAGHQPLMTYILSIDEVEQLTNIDFFFNLPDEIENKIEADYQISDWFLSRH